MADAFEDGPSGDEQQTTSSKSMPASLTPKIGKVVSISTGIKREAGDGEGEEALFGKKVRLESLSDLSLAEFMPQVKVERIDTVHRCSQVGLPASRENKPRVGKAAKEYPFVLEPFQREAILCIDNNESVLVSAHISADKTVCADMASLEGRKRKIKFDPMELQVLVDETNKHLNEIHQRNLTVSQRNAIWEEISEKVNAVGKKMRTVNEVKRRYQDIRRRTKEKLAYYKASAKRTGGGTVDEMPLTSPEELLTSWEEQDARIAGYDTLNQTEEQESSSEDQPSTSNPPREAASPAEPPAGPEDIDLELLEEQKKQSAALQIIAQEMQVTSSLARAVRCDTQAIATHCRQMVSALSALTTAINSVARGLRDGMQAMTALNPGGESGRPSPTETAKQPSIREGREVHMAGKFRLRKRKHK